MPHLRRTATVIAATLSLAVSACSDQSPSIPPTSPEHPASQVQVAGLDPASEEAVDVLAQGLALALANPEVRQKILEDLRDSPFPKHGIHLRSYFEGARGRGIAEVAARSLGTDVSQYLNILKGVPHLTLSMPRSLDRVNWTGTDDILVFGTVATLEERAAAPTAELGYTTSGEAIQINVWAYEPFPFLRIAPPEHPFGNDPEDVRANAPQHDRRTISSRADEIAAITVAENDGGASAFDMNPDPCEVPDGDPEDACGGGANESVGVRLSDEFTSNNCLSGYGTDDLDSDGVWDECEYQLASRFSPHLRFDEDDDNIQRESYWSVAPHRTEPHWIQIFYAIGYREDGGTPSGGFEAHQGDSEFIILEVEAQSGSHWVLNYATFSAHWQAPTDETSRYGYSALEYAFPETRSRPRAWVAEDKHANYRSQSVCDAGAFYADSCNNPLGYDLPVVILRSANIGNSYFNGVGSTYSTVFTVGKDFQGESVSGKGSDSTAG